MKFKYKGLTIASMIAVLIVSVVAGASAAVLQPADEINPLPGGDLIDSASLVRTPGGLSLTLKASGFEPGTTATAWWLIDKDGNGLDGGDGICNAAGHQIGASGEFNIGSHLSLDEVSEEYCGLLPPFTPGPPLEEADLSAAVYIHILDHGLKGSDFSIQDLVDAMNDIYTGDIKGVGEAIFYAVP